MASAWGSSWGSAWGVSWGSTTPTPTTTTTGGGFIPYRKGERRARGLEWDKRPLDERRKELERTYARITGELTDEDAAPVAAVLKPYVETSHDTALPPLPAIDWQALAANVEAARAVMAELDRLLQQRAEDDLIAILLLS